MFAQALVTQWKWMRALIIGLAVIGLLVPLVGLGRGHGFNFASDDVRELLRHVESVGWFIGILAAFTGSFVAINTWTNDHAGQFIYAMSLPVPRWHYVLLRYGAGAALLVPVTIAVGIGVTLTLSLSTLPPSVQSYGSLLVVRFFLASLLVYTITFALSSPAPRIAAFVGLALFALVLVGMSLEIAGQSSSMVDRFFAGLFSVNGPFGIFFGRWVIIDV